MAKMSLAIFSVLYIWSLSSLSCSADQCSCECFNLDASLEDLDPERQEEILELKKNLTVSPKETASYKRSLISAKDDRPSAQAVGSVGIIFLAVTVILMILMDCSRLFITPIQYNNMA